MIKQLFSKYSLPLLMLSILACGQPMNTTNTADATPPTPPTNLVATAASPGSVALTWDASSDNDMVWQYWIYQGETVISSVHSSSLLLYVVNKLDPAREYCFTVSASDGAGNMSGRSNRACATTPPDLTPPTVPTNLNVTADTPTGITLSWPASTDDGFVAGYRVYRDGVLITTTADTWLTDSGLSTETQYCYAVQAFDAGGNQSALSNLACATTSWKQATMES